MNVNLGSMLDSAERCLTAQLFCKKKVKVSERTKSCKGGRSVSKASGDNQLSWLNVTAIAVFFAIFSTLSTCFAQAQTLHQTKVISGTLRDTRPCFFFTLQGINQADPIVSGSPVFALDRNDSFSTDHFAILLTSLANKSEISVQTSGKAVCGHATVLSVSTP